jgi:CubicO group peptidase (beta-lactamase class C family)
VPRPLRDTLIVAITTIAFLTMCRAPRPMQIAPPQAVAPLVQNATPISGDVRPAAPDTGSPATPPNSEGIVPTLRAVDPTAPPAFRPTAEQQALMGAIDGHMNELVNAKLFHGSVLVAQHGQVILSKGYGIANDEQGTQNTPQTHFRLASLTKQFTALAIMQLQTQGKLKVTDSVCQYVDPCPAAWQPITLHNLLTHTSGIPSYTDFMDYESTQMQPATPEQLISRVRDQPLLFVPGSTYQYGNSGYVILGTIIEQVSGMPYGDYLKQAIFEPLQMHDTGIDHNDTRFTGQAAGYSTFTDKAAFLDTSTLFACGSLYSTVEDMYRWDQALYTDALLPENVRNQMFTPFLNDYGYGWKVTRPNNHLLINHSGLIDGFSTYIGRYPEDRVTVIVLGNMSSADSVGIGKYLASLVIGG